ncbi:hypothetical protein HDK77DRAFT_441150 [Phyllosticta capitalensis]|uniref:Indole-diterpene biosynthesis protein PaxU n=2 Tax=Phyllosticta capitalensis TaxID=121624 RepID=A0ABR1Z3K3_9PEZI
MFRFQSQFPLTLRRGSTLSLSSTRGGSKATYLSMSTVAAAAILPGFKPLNHKTYLYTPPELEAQASRRSKDPKLILLATWMDAHLKHVSKYVLYYRELYPSSPILLLTSSTSDFFFNTKARQKKELAPALAAVHNFIPKPDSEGLFVHAMSNGGSGNLAVLAEQYQFISENPLPAQAMVLDSLPGHSRLLPGLTAMSMNLPKPFYVRWPMQFMLGMLLIFFYHIPPTFGFPTMATLLRHHLNSPELFRKEAPRWYVYSDGDTIIPASDVEEHAEEAKKLGMVVRKENFGQSPHVGHMRKDPDRYWTIVCRAWEERV